MPLKKAENPQESSDRRMDMGFWISSNDEFKQMKKEILGK